MLVSYNAAVFQISTFNNYNIIAIDIASEKYKELKSNSMTYRNLSNAQWRQVYDVKYVSEHGDLYLAIDRIPFSTSEQTLVPVMSEYWPLEIAHGTPFEISFIAIESPDWIRYDSFEY